MKTTGTTTVGFSVRDWAHFHRTLYSVRLVARVRTDHGEQTARGVIVRRLKGLDQTDPAQMDRGQTASVLKDLLVATGLVRDRSLNASRNGDGCLSGVRWIKRNLLCGGLTDRCFRRATVNPEFSCLRLHLRPQKAVSHALR